jgi:hypothetical protein
MVEQVYQPVQAKINRNSVPMHGLLQRKCACGQHTTDQHGECTECRKNRVGLQRRAANAGGSEAASPITHEASSSAGEPLALNAGPSMETRFHHDFSQVRVHTVTPKQIQTKLTVNHPGDKYEQEADRVSEYIMSMPNNETNGLSDVPAKTQGKSATFARGQGLYPQNAQGEILQRKPLASTNTSIAQSQIKFPEKEEGGLLQTKELSGQTQQVPPQVAANINSLRGSGQPLTRSARAFFEPRFGVDFSGVQVHADAQAFELTRSLNARAFTVGRDMVFGTGEYSPETTSGRNLLAHELTHVMQQNPGMPKQPAPTAYSPLSSNTLQRQATVKTTLNADRMIQRVHELDTNGATQYTTATGNFYRFSMPTARSNSSNRPHFINPASAMVTYTGTGNNGSVTIHPAVASALDTLMSALRTEGNRIDDESMKQAVVASGYRASAVGEGARYLRALRKTIRKNPSIFDSLTFPTSLEDMARSELGTSGSTQHRAFVDALAAEPGWNRTLAQRLVDITGRFKAPRGGSPHHSGLVVDIDFPYATSATDVERHGIDRNRNANARRAAAGVWLDSFSRDFDFDTYSTSAEIWHQEWLNWAGTTADPAQAGAGTAGPPTEPSSAETPIGHEGTETGPTSETETETEAAPSLTATATPASSTPPAIPATGTVAVPAAGSTPTSDVLLNDWLAIHSSAHLSSDLAWILSQWPAGGSLANLNAGFRANVEALLRFVAATTGASFTIISYARSPQKQHVMHVAQYIRRDKVAYNNYRFSRWPDMLTAGGRSAVAALDATQKATRFTNINNPEVLGIVWDTGTLASSKEAARAIAGSTGYGIGATNPVANGGSTYAWPTGNSSSSRHGTGNAVDADPVQIPNEVVIRMHQASTWPGLGEVQAAIGMAHVTQVVATPATTTTPEQQAGYRITGLSDIARRDAFLELFFSIRSAARAGFVDPNHFQAP